MGRGCTIWAARTRFADRPALSIARDDGTKLAWTYRELDRRTRIAAWRLHDIGRTGWWILIGFVPLIGSIVLLVFALLDSQPGDNQYGANPKGV